MTNQSWRVILSADARRDFSDIVRWTTRKFGKNQARLYRDTLFRAIKLLEDGPAARGSRARDNVLPGIRSLSVARKGRRGRHFLIYRIAGQRLIEISRILHEKMELGPHLLADAGRDDEAG